MVEDPGIQSGLGRFAQLLLDAIAEESADFESESAAISARVQAQLDNLRDLTQPPPSQPRE